MSFWITAFLVASGFFAGGFILGAIMAVGARGEEGARDDENGRGEE